MGTIVPKMGTPIKTDISVVLFGKTRQAVLALFCSHPDELFYVRQVVRFVRAGLGAVQRELATLTEVGILVRTERGRQIYYQANQDSPIFSELRQVILKTAGLVDVLRAALLPLERRIALAFVYGSFARGGHRRGSDVDFLVVGDVTFGEVVSALQGAQEKLGREINPSVYPRAEFWKKLAEGHHFLSSILTEPKILVMGDARELARVAGQRVAPRAQDEPARNPRAARHRRS